MRVPKFAEHGNLAFCELNVERRPRSQTSLTGKHPEASKVGVRSEGRMFVNMDPPLTETCEAKDKS